MKTVIFLALISSIYAEINDEQIVISGNNQFAADLYKEISKQKNPNFLFSPFSAESVLALLQSGAGGSTAEDLRRGLHLPNDQPQIEASFKALHKNLKNNPGFTFHTANKLYIDNKFNLKNAFRSVAADVFDADAERVDFSQNRVAAASINQWVEKKTNDKIHDLIKPDKLGADSKAVLINALYFKGNWSAPFRKHATRKSNFYASERDVSQVDTMFMSEDTKTFDYAENKKIGARFLRLNFQGKELSMTFVLPFERFKIDTLEEHITQVFQPQNYAREFVNMTIPKFKTETETDVKNIMLNLGVTKPFSPAEADFSGISDNRLFVSDVIQKTFIDVHESGVEAAAATYAGLALLSIQSTPDYVQFHLDQPFIYFIKIKGLVVFAGRVGNPKH